MVNGEPSVQSIRIQFRFSKLNYFLRMKYDELKPILKTYHDTEGSPFTIRNHPVKTQTFDFLYIFACNTSQMQFPCNIRLSLAYNHDKQILSGFL